MSALWIPVVAIVGSFLMVILVVYFGTRAKLRRSELRANVQMKLIDKFGSSADFVRFLESPDGQQFLEQPRRMTRERMMGTLTGGLVTTFIGLAFAGCAFVLRDEGFWVPAFILLAVGLALFVSTMISWKLMSGQSPAAGPGQQIPAGRS